MNKPSLLVCRAIAPEVIARLEQHFEVRANQADEPWSPAQLIEALQGRQALFATGSERIDSTLLQACPDLRICANMSVGFNNFDVEAMTAHGVVGTNAPGVLTETTADFGFALLLAAARRVSEGERYLRAGRWKRWQYDTLVGSDVHGSTLGILGMGRIGQALARRGYFGFGMKVIYHNRSRLEDSVERETGARYVSKQELLRSADHLVLVLPYSKASLHAIGAAELALMKPTATLVNIARGGIVDDAALAQALRDRRIAAAGLDVYEGEPSVHPGLLEAPRVVLTPHIGSATGPTRLAMANLAADNLINFFCGDGPTNPVNPEVLNGLAA
ncbi:2-hydroxyacid dehydrogenase [Polaromonas jejuensis]|uniref:2-hydroxyacid dehydrogenase n=1 Tax=Polaromonas jejuensis TaxID=457502 RepID=A0ABW0Q921_9BURK|nr:D-glycerate dehydrogenase [Polaromonas jejuensis]